jgi:pyruvate/2-oxoglutarate dehydrogenase complex dihydrolipoamide acyltransferase (E2) component
VGKAVKADEIIAKIETDKVTVDILAKYDGVITKYHAAEGETVAVGAKFCDIDPAGTPSGAAPAKPAQATPTLKVSTHLNFNIITPITTRLLNPSKHHKLPPQPQLPLHLLKPPHQKLLQSLPQLLVAPPAFNLSPAKRPPLRSVVLALRPE